MTAQERELAAAVGDWLEQQLPLRGLTAQRLHNSMLVYDVEEYLLGGVHLLVGEGRLRVMTELSEWRQRRRQYQVATVWTEYELCDPGCQQRMLDMVVRWLAGSEP